MRQVLLQSETAFHNKVREILQSEAAAAQMTWTYVLNTVENVKKLYHASLLIHGLFNRYKDSFQRFS